MDKERDFDENDLVLKPATAADFKFTRTVFNIAYRETMERQYGVWDQVAQDKKFEEVWKDSNIQIISFKGQPVGFIQIDELPSEIWIDEIVLVPVVQGKGIGSYLVRKIQETAQQSQIPVKLNVLHANPAIQLYNRLGFKQIGDTETYTEMEWQPDWKVKD